MGENSDDNDPFEEDIVFDQSGLLTSRSSYSRQQMHSGFIPTFMLFIRTVFLCVAFTGLGLCSSLSQGPIIQLEVAVGIPAEQAFHSFTAQSIGMLFGGLLGSALFDIYNRQFLIFVSLVWMSVSISVLPFTIPVSFWWTLSNLAAIGAGLAFLFTGSNVLCLDLWGKQGGASLQSLHFSFAVGAFVAPILIHPFLSGSYPPQFVGGGGGGGPPSNFTPPITSLPLLLSSPPIRVKRDVENASLTDDGASPSPPFQNLSFPPANLSEPEKGGPSSEGALAPAASNSSDADAKIPKPKPSFTNANLIPETSKWKRPSQKEPPKAAPAAPPSLPPSVGVPERAGDPTGPTEVKEDQETAPPATPSEPPDEASTPPVQEEDALTSSPALSSQTEIVEDETEAPSSDAVKEEGNETALDVGLPSEEDAPPSPSPAPLVTTPMPPPPSLAPPSEEALNQSTPTRPPPAAELVLASTAPSAPPDEEGESDEFAIDFSTDGGSLTSVGYEDDPRPFPDYPPGGGGEEKAWLGEPQVLEQKEEPASAPEGDEEASTISVTASFDDHEAPSTDPQQEHRPLGHQSKPGTFSNLSDPSGRLFEGLVDRFRHYGVTSLHLAYLCVGAFLVLNAFVSVLIMCHNPREPRSKQDEGPCPPPALLLLAVFSLFMFTAEALQGAVHHLLASAHTEHGPRLSTKGLDGAAIFWGLASAVRFLCILISGCLRLKPGKVLVAATFFMVMGSVFLCVGTFGKPDFLWGGIVVVALGLGPVLPTSFLWMAEHMRVTHRMCAFMMVLSSFGNSVTHTSLTHVLADSHTYAYILLGLSACSALFLSCSFVLLLLLLRSKRRRSLAAPVGYQLANQEEEEEAVELRRPTPANFDGMSRRLSEMGEAGQALLID